MSTDRSYRRTLSSTRRFLFGSLAFLLFATDCAASGASGQRATAAQQALDRTPDLASVPVGMTCNSPNPAFVKPENYAGFPGSHVGPPLRQGDQPGTYGAKYCRVIGWDKDLLVGPKDVRLGRYVVEKVGEDQQTAGLTYSVLRARFEANSARKNADR